MGKRLPYLALAIILAMSSCLLMGGKVRAASPIMYEGNVQWLVGRRNTIDRVDFNYSTYEMSLPMFGTIPRIYTELGGIPSNKLTDQHYSSLPAAITVQSPDLCLNGGYLYISFVVGYSMRNSVTTGGLNIDATSPKAYRYNQASLSYAAAYGVPLTYNTNYHSAAITEFSIIPQEDLNTQRYVVDLYNVHNGAYNGSNFPKWVYFMDNTQFETDTGISQLYIYQDTSINWYKTNFFTFKITVPAANIDDRQYNSIYFLLNDMIGADFVSRDRIINVIDTYVGTTTSYTVPASDLIYLCPVYCYATSASNYEELEVYLQSINSNLSAILGGQAVPQSVLESYAALGSEAREAAEEAVRAMSVAQPTFNESDYDVFSNIDSVAMQQFSGVLSFLSLKRILPILLAALALVTIGYLFFGKK